MPFNLLLLPLLGGYIFARYWYRTSFYVIRSDKERLIIISSVCGLASILLIYLFYHIGIILFPCNNYSFCIPVWWDNHIRIPYSGISFAAFLIGAFGWYPLNWLRITLHKGKENKSRVENGITELLDFDNAQVEIRQKEIDRIIYEDGNSFELKLRRAQEKDLLVLTTLSTGKVYIGWVQSQYNPALPTGYISLLVIESGFREASNKQIYITNNYSSFYIAETSEESDDSIQKSNLDNLVIVIPVSQIVSLSIYNKLFLDKHSLPQPKTYVFEDEQSIIKPSSDDITHLQH